MPRGCYMESSGQDDLDAEPNLEIRLLGPLIVRRRGATIAFPASRKVRALLAYLVLRSQPVTRSQLCDLLWDVPNDPRGELRWCLSKLRALVDDDDKRRIETRDDTIGLNLNGCFVDAIEVARAVREGFENISIERLQDLADFFNGDFLMGLEVERSPSFNAWAVAQRRHFRNLQTDILRRLARQVRSGKEKTYLDRWLQLAPFDLEPHQALLESLADQNRIKEGEEHLSATAKLFEAEGIDVEPLRKMWLSARTQPTANPRVALQAYSPAVTRPALPANPSIAVLPFTNMSGSPDQEPFVDGLTEDLITDLSRTAGLFVIARNSVFAYKGRSVDVRLVAQELGVRYVLEGSVRRAEGRVRINAQLIDAVDGEHLWAERFDRTVEDVFSLQDDVNAKIVEALVGRLTPVAPRKRSKNVEAHDLCVRARLLTEESPQTAREAYLLLKRSIELEPSYAEANGLLAYNRWLAWTHFGEPETPNRAMAVALAEKAVELDPSDAGCRYFLGTILAYERRWQESDAAFAAALRFDPNHADTWAALSDMSVLSGRIAESLEQIEKALRLNPYPACWYFCHLGQAQYAAGNYEGATATLRREDTYRTNSRKFLAASLAQLGRLDEARREAELFLVAHPHFTIDHWTSSQPLRDTAVRDHFIDGFRKANLPEA